MEEGKEKKADERKGSNTERKKKKRNRGRKIFILSYFFLIF